MKKNILLCLFVIISGFASAQVFADQAIAINYASYNEYSHLFEKAYELNPEIPRGVLEAISFTNTRFHHTTHDADEIQSCTGIPKAYGIMGLTLDGKGAFNNNLITVSELSGYSVNEIIESPEISILAYAKAYAITKRNAGITSNRIEDQVPVMVELSELPVSSGRSNITIGQDFAANANIYSILDFLNKPENQSLYRVPQRNIDFVNVFGQENYNVLSAQSVILSDENVTNGAGNTFRNNLRGMMTTDYGPALWTAACVNNYTYGRSMAVTAVAIHDQEGTYAGTISWFASCSNPYYTSSEYVLRSSDGQITQMVLESNTAHHVYTENDYTIGLEHEGYAYQTGWYTTAMYNSSAALVRNICARHSGVSTLACWYGPSCDGNYNQCLVDQCIRIKGHQQFPNGGHFDPGLNWDWRRYYHLLNPMPAVTPLTAASGTTYDGGGANANYANSERRFTLIAPTGATKVTLTFSSFNLESGADNLFIYNGSTTAAPLIGKYSGTTSPGTISSTGGAMLIEFRSDCSVTSTGWAANWTSNGSGTTTPPTPNDVTAPTTSITTPSGYAIQNFTANFTDADETGGSGLKKSFYHVIDNNGTDWRANKANGFYRDNFNGTVIHADWTKTAGTWAVSSGILKQSDESLANTIISSGLAQNLSSTYMYQWTGKMDGTGTNKRAGLHFMCSSGTTANRGTSYMVWFRSNQSTVEIYKSVNDVLGSPVKTAAVTIAAATYYDYKVIYDRATGVIDVYVNNAKVVSWTDSAPLQTGSYISFRSGGCIYSVDDFYVYRSRTSAVTISVGAATTNDIRYQNASPTTNSGIIKSIVMDNEGNISTVASKGINVDFTAAAKVSVVRDGTTTTDISSTTSKTQLSANWTATSDANSGITKYQYAIGKTAGATDVVNWTDNGTAIAVTRTGLSLTVGQIYYVSVRSVNGAGLVSAATISNGQKVASALLAGPSSSSSVIDNGTLETGTELKLSAYPNPFRDNIAVNYELLQDQQVVITLVDVLGKESILFSNENQSAGTYNLSINTNDLNLSNGVYLIRLKTSTGESFTRVIRN